MSWLEVLAAIFKVIGQIFDLHARDALTQEKIDRVIGSLHEVK